MHSNHSMIGKAVSYCATSKLVSIMLTLAEKAEIVDLARSYSFQSTVDIFNQRHADRPAPLHPRTVASLFSKLKKFGTLERKKRAPSAQKIAEKAALKAQIETLVQQNKHISIRKAAIQLQKSNTTIWKAMKEMKLRSYKMSKSQKQFPNDPPTRKMFCEQLINTLNQEDWLQKKILWTDEKLFRVNGCFNRQNHRYKKCTSIRMNNNYKTELLFDSRWWSRQNPEWVGEVNQVGGDSIMVWAGIIDTQIIGPYFFPKTVNADSYLDMIFNFLLPELHRRGLDSIDICYMHDGAPAHYTKEVRDCLDENFRCWIGRGDGLNRLLAWPPRSPDLNMCDFYLWGYLDHVVNLTANVSTNQIRAKLIEEIEKIPFGTLIKVQANLLKRLHKCIQVDGKVFEHLLKKTG